MGLEWLCYVSFHVDLDYLPSRPFTFNRGALFRNGLVAVHIEIDVLGVWIAVVPIHYLLRNVHTSLPHIAAVAGLETCMPTC
jgi:hypothetical protein